MEIDSSIFLVCKSRSYIKSDQRGVEVQGGLEKEQEWGCLDGGPSLSIPSKKAPLSKE